VFSKYVDDVRTFPGDAGLAWRQRGIAGVREELAHRTVFRLLRWGRLWVLEQDLAVFREVPPPPGVTIEVFRGDWGELSGIATRREIRLFERAAARGRDCLLARREGRPIGWTWSSRAIDPSLEVHPIPLPWDAAYGWNLYVIPSERGSGTGTALVAARLRLAREQGCRKGWRLVAPTNSPSHRTVAKTAGGGNRRIATFFYLKLGPRLFSRYVPEPGASGGAHTPV
jgi:GNAT superfamily N-acetyltransferase